MAAFTCGGSLCDGVPGYQRCQRRPGQRPPSPWRSSRRQMQDRGAHLARAVRGSPAPCGVRGCVPGAPLCARRRPGGWHRPNPLRRHRLRHQNPVRATLPHRPGGGTPLRNGPLDRTALATWPEGWPPTPRDARTEAARNCASSHSRVATWPNHSGHPALTPDIPRHPRTRPSAGLTRVSRHGHPEPIPRRTPEDGPVTPPEEATGTG
jgi:hypothetical protein